MISRQSPEPPYKQVAAELRAQINSGKLAPGAKLPAHATIAHDMGVGVSTVARAIEALRKEGLIDSGTGVGTYVREAWQRKTVLLPAGAQLEVRMPTPREREAQDIDEGVPVVVVHSGGTSTTYPADRFLFTCP